MQITRRAAVALALATPALASARAQGSWRPDRPMRVIVPFAPGGATDVVARLVSDAASQMLGQNIVIE
ncbi:MAG: tripartite tricarboxylate transporter substrate binding protein, partial [Alphaproteobacteria bacterium]